METKALILGLVLAFVLVAVITPPRAGATTNTNPVQSIRLPVADTWFASVGGNHCTSPVIQVSETLSTGTVNVGLANVSTSAIPTRSVIVSATLYYYFSYVQINITGLGSIGAGELQGHLALGVVMGRLLFGNHRRV